LAEGVMTDLAHTQSSAQSAGIRSAPLKDAKMTSMYHPPGWHMDGSGMPENVHQLKLKPGDSEKITINVGFVDLGHIDLMVQEGFYSNRTDFIRTAIRNQLERHADVVKQSTVRKSLDLGLRHYSREDLEAARLAGERMHIQVLGLVTIAPDVTPELARATIDSIVVLGAMRASPAVKAALADRMQ
jgi:Arc/MetJ-type ribon-helix-helix transcriptional regulator